MSLADSEHRYGTITKLLHWSIALLILLQYFWVYWKQYVLPQGSALGSFFIASLHKPLGSVTLILAVCAILWRCYNPKPAFPTHMPTWKRFAAKTTHKLLYLAILVMPTSGMLMTNTAGYGVNLFNLYTLPALIAPNKNLSHLFYDIHEISSYILLGLIILHFLAAMEHYFIEKDNVLQRILPYSHQ